jgi:hypothetical protein
MRIETEVACRTKCVLRPDESGRHEVEISNRGPLAANFTVQGECRGPLLQYAPSGMKAWTTSVTVPAGLREPDHKRKVSSDVELRNPAELGPSGSQEEIQVDVTRHRPQAPSQRPVTLTVQLQLRS